MSTSRKTIVNKKKKKTASTSRTQRKPDSSGTARGVIGIMLICLGVLMLVCLCMPSEASFIVFLRHFVQGIAGSICLVVPILVLWCGALVAFSAKAHVRPRTLICCSIILLIVLTLMQLLKIDDILRKIDATAGMKRNFVTFLSLSYQNSSLMRQGGGVIGALLAWPLWRLLDVWGSILVLVFALVADVMALTNTNLHQISTYFEEYFEKTRDDFSAWREEQRADREARALEKQEEAAAEAYSYDMEPEEFAQEEKPKRTRKKRPTGDGVYTDQEAFSGEAQYVQETVSAQDAPHPVRRRARAVPQEPVSYEAEPVEPQQPARSRRRMYSESDVSADEETVSAPQAESFGDEQVPVEDEYPTLSRTQNVPETAWYGDMNPARQTGRHLYSEPYEEDGIQKDAQAAGYDVVEPSFDPAQDAGDTDEPQVEDVSEEPVVMRDEPVFEEEISNSSRRRRTLKAAVPVKAPASTVEDVSADDAALEPPRRRLDDTPLVLPKKEESPLDKKPIEEYRFPPLDLLKPSPKNNSGHSQAKDEENAKKLVSTLASFGIQAKVLNVTHGPAITRYELQPAPGVKVSRIVNLVDDIALNMAAAGVRIEAPIPGKPAVGIEIPNESISMVSLRDVLDSKEFANNSSSLACALGKDIAGKNVLIDLAKMPHVLIAGATGSGKSVCINTLINSIIYRATPEEVRLILIDPKVVELSIYNGIPHLLIPVVTDPKKASGALSWAVMEMDHRYKRFAGAGVRDIRGYNANLKEGEEPMPKIVVIIDELADLMMVAPGEVEDSICRLAQLARAAGIHLVIATQRPSVNVITGVIKANIPSRIAFAVSSQIDSRTILDGAGAEKLLGKGDMLYAPQGSNKPLRVQGCFVSDDEVTQVVEYVKQRHDVSYNEDVIEHLNNAEAEQSAPEQPEPAHEHVDELLQQAIEIAVESGQASISMLQRRLRIGYARAGRLIDEMAVRGIVAQAEGAKPRAVLITREEYRQMFETEE